MVAYLYTFVTHDERYFGSLMDSCKKQGIKPIVEGMGTPWKGFVERHKSLIRFLDTLQDDDIVINVDGFDTVVLAPLDTIVHNFKKTKCDVLFSMTENNGNMFHRYVQHKVGFLGELANAGMFMGYTKSLKTFLERIITYGEPDDQVVVNKILHEFPNAKIDTEYDVFCNIITLKNTSIRDGVFYYGEKTPCLLSAPGCSYLNPILRTLEIKESPFSCNVYQRVVFYAKFFVNDILTLILVLIFLFFMIPKLRRGK